MDIQEETKPFLIINSDDLGFNEFRDKGMLDAYASNSISESTMIINGYNIKNQKEPLTIELMCHVGYPCKVAGAAFSKSENRQEELQFLSSKQFKDYIKSHYRLTNYQAILNKLETV
ncbi:Glycoside hydrolase/deacetylase, beta/alpha-barrel [Pseudocohnilembus persalinus]|uniref:Carbohydrate deacetylase n=1 Tax=Pseudocohnilembus persalinus TaxID=266149 RepID=A0A0V0QX40_PSEPJ|nr:Glycoside hydrolase/deacetylase, beta/alpha-barrel [Pseudocohnilembus persalinus]|eukprot:KRX06823.1 Glycoside hydrolase/deacetylase, beta/alpha-barrel [Pseudocohnilembus persalinus]